MTDLSTAFICFASAFSVYWICHAAMDIFMRRTRSKNIAAHGWPPKHLDADGDPVEWTEDDEKETA